VAADSTPTTSSVLDSTLFPRTAANASQIDLIRKSLDAALDSIGTITHGATQDAAALTASASNIDAQARPIRAKLEAAQRGAGEAARRIAALEKRIAQGEALAELRTQRVTRLQALRERRAAALDRIDIAITTRSIEREQVAAWLSKHLRPAIRVDIAQRANLAEYVAAVTRALRGTGMHAGQLAEQIAARISPRQLVELVESGDKTSLSRIIQIAADRAQRLINALMSGGTSELVGVAVDDDVQISLLVGPDYRRIEKISTGQRCTAIIPILLSQQSGCLVIDQPEDHLDNAYIVDTLVAAINDRSAELQVIFSTHNANLPVLGEADHVIEMASDGMRGYCRESNELDAPAIVSAITTVMEGGADAFKRRASFYRDHSKTSSVKNES
jgi:ATPase subunit of ABC transporter with duplicated ATPase domains